VALHLLTAGIGTSRPLSNVSDLSPQGGAKRTFDWAALIWRRSGRSPDWIKSKNPACEAVRREAEEDWGR
jgi:hypothetical protein